MYLDNSKHFALRSKWWLIITLAIVFLALSVLSCGQVNGTTVLVTRVIDGDTVEIEGGHRVRYIGIDTPEISEPYYIEAAEANRSLVEGKEIRLEEDFEDKDKYGRLLRYVWVDDIMVNAELVRLGYAYSHSYPPNLKYQAHLFQLENEARERRLGLWDGC